MGCYNPPPPKKNSFFSVDLLKTSIKICFFNTKRARFSPKFAFCYAKRIKTSIKTLFHNTKRLQLPPKFVFFNIGMC